MCVNILKSPKIKNYMNYTKPNKLNIMYYKFKKSIRSSVLYISLRQIQTLLLALCFLFFEISMFLHSTSDLIGDETLRGLTPSISESGEKLNGSLLSSILLNVIEILQKGRRKSQNTI